MELSFLNKTRKINLFDQSIKLSAIVISLILLSPVFFIVLGNFSGTKIYLNFFSNSELIEYSKNSFYILSAVLIITLVIGVISAYLVTFFIFPFSNFFKYSLLLSFAIPPYIYGYTLSAFFEDYGIAFSIFSVLMSEESANKILPNIGPLLGSVISLSLTLFGYIFILARSAFINQSKNQFEVGKSLGFNNYNIFLKIILPSSRPALFIGLSLVGMETLADFGTVSFFGVSTFTTGIYNSWFIFDDLKTANLLSFFLLFFILFFFLIESYSRKNVRFNNPSNSSKGETRKITLNNSKSLLALLFCSLIFFISFLFPLFQMIYWSFNFYDIFQLSEIIKLNINSIKLIFLSSITIILLSFFVNFGIRILDSKLLRFFSSLSISGYAIPGIVISVAIISLLSFIDDFFNTNVRNYFIGSLFGLVLGYCVRFYSISFNTIKTVYLKISKRIDESALLLGFNKFKVFKNIHFPILKKNFVFAFILISIEIIKELPITLILRPFNFETFSTKAFGMASSDLIEGAAIPSLFIILWSSLFIILSIKFFLRDQK